MKKEKKKSFYIWLMLTVAWFCLITFLSHQDEFHSTSFSLSLVDSTVSIRELFGEKMDITGDERWSMNLLLRKVAHLGAFGGLSFLLVMTLHVGEYRLLPGVVFCVLWSFMDELIKPLSPGRHADGPDMILNLIGTALGILTWMVFKSIRGRFSD